MLDNTHQSETHLERMAKLRAASENGAEFAVGGIMHRASQFSEMFDRKVAGGMNPLGVEIEEMLSPVEAIIEGRRTTLFGTNSYLGLNFHPDCIETAVNTVRKYGTGSTASRVAGGNQKLHLKLENDLSEMFEGREAIVFTTGFMANLAVISALAKDGCALFLDSHCHASIFAAAELSGASIVTFKHNDPEDLDRLFTTSTIPAERCMVVVEGLYSVWGDLGNLKPIVETTKRHGGVIVVDEAHSFGLYGDHGRGLCEKLGIESDVDVIVGTFSKSVGVVGGFCITTNPALRALRFLCRPYLYTASLPPAVVASAIESIRIIRNDRDRRTKVWSNAQVFHKGLTGLGFQLCADMCPVGAIRMPNFKVGMAMWRTLLEHGVYVNILVPPGTPDGSVLLRFSVSVAHSPELISKALGTFAEVGRELGVIK